MTFTEQRRAVCDDTKAVVCRGTVSPLTHRRPLYELIHFRFATNVGCARCAFLNRESFMGTSIMSGGSLGLDFNMSAISRSIASIAGGSLNATMGGDPRRIGNFKRALSQILGLCVCPGIQY